MNKLIKMFNKVKLLKVILSYKIINNLKLIKIIKNDMFTYIFNLIMLLVGSRANDVSAQHKTQKGSSAQ